MNCFGLRFFTVASMLPTFALMAEEEFAPPRDNGAWQGLVMIAIAFAFFYFILWRPEQKRRREMEQKRDALQKGDRVTAMGIVGTIVRVQEHTVIVKMFDGSKLEFLKAAISEVSPGGSSEDGKKSDEDGDSDK